MGRPFSDITLYTPTPYSNDSPQYREDTSLENFVSDLYVRKMNGYKPPNVTRVCIQPAYYKIWDRTWKNGSLISIAPEFLRDKYESLDKHGKYQYILDIIQGAMIQLSEEYKWDKSIFEKAYLEVIENEFTFKIDYPTKMSRDKKKIANFYIEKSETKSFGYAIIRIGASTTKVKLFEKRNWYWYDGIYQLAKHAKWSDSDRFGIYYAKGALEIWYSIGKKEVSLFEFGTEVKQVDFSRFFFLG